MKISIWHNIMWSRYKASVFSALSVICIARQTELQVYQIAETSDQRKNLSPTDLSWHQYPYEVLFNESYEAVPRLELYWKIARFTWADDSDAVLLAGYDRPEYWLQAFILLVRRKPFACFCDSTVNDKTQRYSAGLLKRLFFRWCSAVFCYGERAAEYVQLFGVSPSKIIRRCQAAALYEGYTPELALQKRLETYDQFGPPRFLYVGRLSKEKSVDHLLHAFSHVRKQLPNSILLLVGGGPDESRLRNLTKELNLSDVVDFAGSKHDQALYAEYSRATCMVLPSYSEPWGLVVNEALSHGCPVVVSNRCGCVPELVLNGKTGYVFSWGSIEDLADQMILTSNFGDVREISVACLDQISPYTPGNAANSIFEGARQISKTA